MLSGVRAPGVEIFTDDDFAGIDIGGDDDMDGKKQFILVSFCCIVQYWQLAVTGKMVALFPGYF